ncbi:MAG: DUF1491 family protein [Erythrobacter sp.]|jgi:hypothetical protein|uniref:DUF1491 family protein n=1 Tax=Porphyrobacter sp. MBR-155 TaxID=3156464 RepID=UPI002773B963|nr:DUF1491 domain-containing protein [Erythrobacter sp.]MDP2129758.1 DUF1491 family protein [Erythrobacter sp.]MDZ4271466.1 DUF1491 family protein [Erythrobacter sp.]
MSARLPAHLEASAIIRLAESQGGYATVLAKGERDAGTILIVTLCRGAGAVLYERMPGLDDSRSFVATKRENAENKREFSDYLDRRRQQDDDLWLIEVNIADPERFIANLPD